MLAAIIQVRASSERLPGKAFLDLAGEPMLARVVERVAASSLIEEIIVATSTDASDDVIARLCEERRIACYRGSLNNVLERFLGAADVRDVADIVRITGDCPLVDASIIDACIEAYKKGGYDYQSNIAPGERTFPRGLDTEIVSKSSLEKAARNASVAEKEHVTSFIWKNESGEFRLGPIITAPPSYAFSFRLTVDYREDYDLMKHLYERFYKTGRHISVPEVLKYLDANPAVVAVNAFREADHLARINV